MEFIVLINFLTSRLIYKKDVELIITGLLNIHFSIIGPVTKVDGCLTDYDVEKFFN